LASFYTGDICRRKKIRYVITIRLLTLIRVGGQTDLVNLCNRCDVDVNHPCSTCVQSNWECTFKEQARKRGPPKGYIGNLENRLKKMERLLESLSNNGPKPILDDNDDGNEEEEDEEDEEEEEQEERKRPKISPSATNPRPHSTEEIVINTQTPSTLKNPIAQEESNMKGRLNVIEPKITRYIGSSSGLYLMSKTRDEETMRKSLLFKDEFGTYRFGPASDATDDMMVLRDHIVTEKPGDGEEERDENKISFDVLSYLVDS
jgi:hypothetical protein